MSRVAVVLANLFEDSEFTQPVEALKENGEQVVVISSEAGKELKGKQGESTVQADRSIDDVAADDYDALLIPGGFSPDILRADERFVSFVKKFMYQEKPVFAICHGPQLLITADVLRGRRVTGYRSIQMDLKHAGANVFDEEVVVCGNLVTSRQPRDIPAFNREMLAILQKTKTAAATS